MALKRTQIWWKYDTTEVPPIDAPACFSDPKEWANYYEAERQSVWNPESLQKAIMKDMCGDCQLPYQIMMMQQGRCRPVSRKHTPLAREQAARGA
jgi:hypothetical protein